MKVLLKDLLKQADDGGYAIPAFNYSDVWEMEAIIKAAEALHSPVMIATNAAVVETHGVEYLAKQGAAAADQATVPVINHLDHCFKPEICEAAIRAGYPSVMIDQSHCELEHNIAVTKHIVEMAAPLDVAVEGEIGRIKGKSVEGTYNGDDFLVDVPSAVKMARETGVTSLAIGIGNAHGLYKGTPHFDFDRLVACRKLNTPPLVLHGGSGTPDEMLRKAIELGIRKINVATELRMAYMEGLESCVGERDFYKMCKQAKSNVEAVARQKIRLFQGKDPQA